MIYVHPVRVLRLMPKKQTTLTHITTRKNSIPTLNVLEYLLGCNFLQQIKCSHCPETYCIPRNEVFESVRYWNEPWSFQTSHFRVLVQIGWCLSEDRLNFNISKIYSLIVLCVFQRLKKFFLSFIFLVLDLRYAACNHEIRKWPLAHVYGYH